MPRVIYGSFPSFDLAEKATGALMDHGAHAEDISLVSKETEGRRDFAAHSATLAEREPAIMRDTDTSFVPRDLESPPAPAVQPEVWTSSADWPSGVSPAPVDREDADRNWNTNTEKEYLADRDEDHNDLHAKGGISTTTPADSASGAVKGAAIGLGLGAAAALASIAIPGFGLITGGGALATAIAGAVGTTAAGAVAGGVHGYLKDQGVPEEAAWDYNQTYESGGAILACQAPSGDLDEATIQELMTKYGGTNVSGYGGYAM